MIRDRKETKERPEDVLPRPFSSFKVAKAIAWQLSWLR
jgi:hypothetical protein